MCVNDIRTQEIPFGLKNNLGPQTGPGIIGGLLFFPGQGAKRTVCAEETTILVPKVMGVAAHMRTDTGALVTDPTTVMLVYLAANWRMQKIMANGNKAGAYVDFLALTQRKFIGGFGSGDIGTREIYATNFGAGFPEGTPAYGGSDNAYGVVIQWEQPAISLGESMCLIDWGWSKSLGIES